MRFVYLFHVITGVVLIALLVTVYKLRDAQQSGRSGVVPGHGT